MIQSCIQYDNSELVHFDCSYNDKFVLNFYLPKCRHLYATNCQLEYIDLNFTPDLHFFDCENNNLSCIMEEKNYLKLVCPIIKWNHYQMPKN